MVETNDLSLQFRVKEGIEGHLNSVALALIVQKGTTDHEVQLNVALMFDREGTNYYIFELSSSTARNFSHDELSAESVTDLVDGKFPE